MAENMTIPTDDGTALHGVFYPSRDARGTLIISHGLGEHGGCYVPLCARSPKR